MHAGDRAFTGGAWALACGRGRPRPPVRGAVHAPARTVPSPPLPIWVAELSGAAGEGSAMTEDLDRDQVVVRSVVQARTGAATDSC
jgi:hypothetical protein